MARPAMILLALMLAAAFPSSAQRNPRSTDTIEALYWSGPVELDARPDKPIWRKTRPIAFQHDWRGDPLVGNMTVVRAAWTDEDLWLLFTCVYDTLKVGPDPQTTRETERLWTVSDVAEVFIAPNPGDLMRYREFQVSPMGQWIDLSIDRDSKSHDTKWDSGFRSVARVDSGSQTWVAELAIPLKAFGVAPPAAGTRWRLNFFRWEHGPPRRAMSWQPTHTSEPNFHVPQAFGWLLFRKDARK